MFELKQEIKIKMLADIDRPAIISKGDWIDLRCAEDTVVGRQPVTYVPLGVAMALPEGYEAHVVVRSSTPKKQHIWCVNNLAVIDNSYRGNEDEWKLIAAPIGCSQTVVHKNDRICQFRIVLSQKATMWQRIKHILSNGVKLVFVDDLGNENRGGTGSTGVSDWTK